jgi:hypothetical protein
VALQQLAVLRRCNAAATCDAATLRHYNVAALQQLAVLKRCGVATARGVATLRHCSCCGCCCFFLFLFK